MSHLVKITDSFYVDPAAIKAIEIKIPPNISQVTAKSFYVEIRGDGVAFHKFIVVRGVTQEEAEKKAMELFELLK